MAAALARRAACTWTGSLLFYLDAERDGGTPGRFQNGEDTDRGQ
jgi:hypothetical protein